jgi:hypothetical protein
MYQGSILPRTNGTFCRRLFKLQFPYRKFFIRTCSFSKKLTSSSISDVIACERSIFLSFIYLLVFAHSKSKLGLEFFQVCSLVNHKKRRVDVLPKFLITSNNKEEVFDWFYKKKTENFE